MTTAKDLLDAFMSDLELTYGAGKGGYEFTADGVEHEMVVDEGYFRDGSHVAKATIWRCVPDTETVQVATVEFTAQVTQ